MQLKLKQTTDNAIYFTFEYVVSFRLERDGKIKAICECGDFVLRHCKKCKHIKDAMKLPAYETFLNMTSAVNHGT